MNPETKSGVQNEIKDQILKLADIDEEMRSGDKELDLEKDEAIQENLKRILDQYGSWPSFDEEVSKKAALVVQHMIDDPESQKKYLKWMIDELGEDNFIVARLKDRVRLNKGKNQLYGTQYDSQGEVEPIEGGIKAANQRRSNIDNLEPLTK